MTAPMSKYLILRCIVGALPNLDCDIMHSFIASGWIDSWLDSLVGFSDISNSLWQLALITASKMNEYDVIKHEAEEIALINVFCNVKHTQCC